MASRFRDPIRHARLALAATLAGLLVLACHPATPAALPSPTPTSASTEPTPSIVVPTPTAAPATNPESPTDTSTSDLSLPTEGTTTPTPILSLPSSKITPPPRGPIGPGVTTGSPSIRVTVFLDANGNGVRDPGENGVAGVAVNLVDLTQYALVQPTLTDSSGAAVLVNFKPAHSYKVTTTAPGYVTTSSPVQTLSPTAGTPDVTFGVQKNPNAFPSITLSFVDTRRVHGGEGALQMADYDAPRHRILFYPWGNQPQPDRNHTGTMLSYDTSKDFAATSSWQSYPLGQILNPSAAGRGGGFLDDSNGYAYLPPSQNFSGADRVVASLFVRANLSADLSTGSAYDTFDLATLRPAPRHYGWYTGLVAAGSAYFTPTFDNVNRRINGTFVQYDTSKSFDDPSAWHWFDLQSIDPEAAGFQSIAFKAPYVYLIPDGGNLSKIVRYDTNQPFTARTSYAIYDLKNVNPAARAFTGAMIVGNDLVMVPFLDIVRPISRASTAVLYDTTRSFTSRDSYATIDLTTVDPLAGGYQWGWVDRNGFVWFVPDGAFADGRNDVRDPPFVAWNSQLPFSQPTSWTAYPSATQAGSEMPSSGAAYDPTTNTAYTAPQQTIITRIQETFP
jgi:hypothetical protein